MDPIQLIQPHREITGISAVLLPFRPGGRIDWEGFEQHVARTCQAGLIPAVNMDTGYVNLLEQAERLEVLQRAQRVVDSTGGVRHRLGRGKAKMVAGAFVHDDVGASFAAEAYRRAMSEVAEFDAMPVLFQSPGLTAGSDDEVFARHERITAVCDQAGIEFIAFELNPVFVPFGKIYSLDLFIRLMQLTPCLGAKHSSLSRELEWERLQARDQHRPEFTVYTGNDLAIDMVMYGSDYLLGLSTMAPDLFALRDHCWELGDSRFFELNDWLQYLGCFTFRPPVPAYKHSAAMMLKLRGWLQDDLPHPASETRPETDRQVLSQIAAELEDRVSSFRDSPSAVH